MGVGLATDTRLFGTRVSTVLERGIVAVLEKLCKQELIRYNYSYGPPLRTYHTSTYGALVEAAVTPLASVRYSSMIVVS